MPVEPVTFYTAVCDGCQKNLTERYSEFSAWAQPDIAVSDVTDNGGAQADDGRLACEDCRSKYMTPLSDDDDAWDTEDALLDDGDNDAMTRLLAVAGAPVPEEDHDA